MNDRHRSVFFCRTIIGMIFYDVTNIYIIPPVSLFAGGGSSSWPCLLSYIYKKRSYIMLTFDLQFPYWILTSFGNDILFFILFLLVTLIFFLRNERALWLQKWISRAYIILGHRICILIGNSVIISIDIHYLNKWLCRWATESSIYIY